MTVSVVTPTGTVRPTVNRVNWSQIQFNDSVIDFITRLEQVDIRYAGGGSLGSVYMDRANVAIVNSGDP